jgi:hypothetical protein
MRSSTWLLHATLIATVTPIAAWALPPADLSRVGYSGAQAQRADPSLSSAAVRNRVAARSSFLPGPDYRANPDQPGYVRADVPHADYLRGRARHSEYPAYAEPYQENYHDDDHHHHHHHHDDYGYRPGYAHLHNHWRPGSWSSNYRPYYGGYYSAQQAAVSLGGITAVYSNPFYARPAVIAVPALDYSAPIHVPQADHRETTEEMILSERAIRLFDEARAAFRGEDFRRALDLTDRALELLPGDTALHEFRALVLFAAGNYADASAAIHSVLAVAPGWDRQTIEQLYAAPNRYATDVNELAAYVNARTGDAAGQFLLSYHLLALGETAAAAKVLLHVQTKHPDDRVTQNLLESIRRAGR